MMKARKIMILLAACLLLMSNGQAWGKTRMLQGKQQEQKLSATARSLARQGYVNIKDVDKSIRVSLMYARADNFVPDCNNGAHGNFAVLRGFFRKVQRRVHKINIFHINRWMKRQVGRLPRLNKL